MYALTSSLFVLLQIRIYCSFTSSYIERFLSSNFGHIYELVFFAFLQIRILKQETSMTVVE